MTNTLHGLVFLTSGICQAIDAWEISPPARRINPTGSALWDVSTESNCRCVGERVAVIPPNRGVIDLRFVHTRHRVVEFMVVETTRFLVYRDRLSRCW